MKRSLPLIELSREHHAALSLALHAKRAAAAGGEVALGLAAQVVERFRLELLPHFEEEERWLLPALGRAGASGLVERTLADHVALAELAARLAAPATAGIGIDDTLRAFAERLSGHVRFEERELFPAAERLPGF